MIIPTPEQIEQYRQAEVAARGRFPANTNFASNQRRQLVALHMANYGVPACTRSDWLVMSAVESLLMAELGY